MCTALALHPKQLKTVKPGLVEFFEICNEYVFVSNTMYTIKNARRVEILRMFVPCFHTWCIIILSVLAGKMKAFNEDLLIIILKLNNLNLI